jgi:drug/metabolite transporter (DMT)-like permease
MNANFKAYAALILVCFFWGTTYLAARMGVAGFPAFMFMGIRNTTAGLLLLGFLFLTKRGGPFTWRDARLQIVPGLCMITFGTGIVGWAVKFIPSGLAALICSMIPILTIVLNLTLKKKKINWQILAGMVLGFTGVLLIFGDNLEFVHDAEGLTGIVVVLVSCVSWCLGGMYTQTYKSESSAFFNAGLQMLTGGIGLFGLSLLSEDWSRIPTMNSTSLLALLYLIAFGSILAFVSYLYAMSKLPAGLVSVYAYINPLVAILLGLVVLHEHVSWFTAAAFVVTMGGVFLVKSGYSLQQRL